MRQNDALRSADADRDFNCEQQNNEMSLSVDSIHSNVYIGTGLASTYRRWGVVIGNWGGSRNQAVEGPLHQQNGIFRFDHSTLRQTTLQALQLRQRHLLWLRAQATTTLAAPALAVIARDSGCGGECPLSPSPNSQPNAHSGSAPGCQHDPGRSPCSPSHLRYAIC